MKLGLEKFIETIVEYIAKNQNQYAEEICVSLINNSMLISNPSVDIQKAMLYYLFGRILLKTNRTEKAIHCFNTAATINSNIKKEVETKAINYIKSGIIFLQNDQYEKAIYLFKKSDALITSVNCLEYIALSLLYNGDFDEAEQYIKKFLLFSPYSYSNQLTLQKFIRDVRKYLSMWTNIENALIEEKKKININKNINNNHYKNLEAPNNNSFRLIVMGCAHLGNPEVDVLDFINLFDKIACQQPDVLLFLGSMVDLMRTHNSGHAIKFPLNEKKIKKLWKLYDLQRKKFNIPIYDLTSERSIPSNNWKYAEKLFLDRFHKRYYSFEFKDNLFICLDSEWRNDDSYLLRGKFNKEQIEFLKYNLSKSQKYSNIILASHAFALNYYDKNGTNWWFKEIHGLIKGKVSYVFGACNHSCYYDEIDNVKYVSIGGINGGLGRAGINGFLIIDFIGNKIICRISMLDRGNELIDIETRPSCLAVA